MSINRLVFWRARAVVLACLGLAVLPAAADDSPLELRGFGTLGLARSSSNQADYLRDLSQPDGSRGQWSSNLDSLLGFQANLQGALQNLIQNGTYKQLLDKYNLGAYAVTSATINGK